MTRILLFRTLFACLILAAAAVPDAGAQVQLIGRGEVERMVWGGVEPGWHRIYRMEDTRMRPAPQDRVEIVLDDNSLQDGGMTELLLDFDLCGRRHIESPAPAYEIGDVNIFPSRNVRKRGECAAGFLQLYNRVEIFPGEESVFFAGPRLGSFTIDFFIHPINTHDRARVLSWSAPVIDRDGERTGVTATFRNGRLRWRFENVFFGSGGDPVSIELEEYHPSPTHAWHHHALVYDASTGLMALYHEGRESGLLWVTEDGSEDSTLLRGFFSPYLSVPMVIGERYLGYVDEFRISRGQPAFALGDYALRGTVLSEVIDLTHRGTELVKVDWNGREEDGTAIRVYCRMSPVYFRPERPEPGDGVTAAPAWIPVKNHRVLEKGSSGEGLAGRYLQWKAELLGTGREATPVLYDLTITLEPDPPPGPPILLDAEPADGGVVLTWVTAREGDIAGYRVHYGSASGAYFGPNSPMYIEKRSDTGDTRRVRIDGLTNEQVYYFRVTAVDAEGQESVFSRELVARPSGIYGR